jgi:hypothetical protein
MSTEEVCGILMRAGVDEATVGKVFAARLQPQNLGDGDEDRKFALGVPAPGGRAYLVIYRFRQGEALVKATPLDEGGPDWRPRWLAVEGPFPGDRETVEAKSRELTA